MTRDELILYCREILIITQNKRIQKMFHARPENMDIVIEKISRKDINSFCSRMVERLGRFTKEK